jgi:periplasmic divalent cation tolerance protein
MHSFHVVLVTVPNKRTARRLARAILEARLAACVNVVPGIESHYLWQAKIQSSFELMLVIKTTRKHLARLEQLVVDSHPYDTPEFVALPIIGGNRRYLEWIRSSCK